MVENDLTEMILGYYEQPKNHPHKKNERQPSSKRGWCGA